MGWVCVVWIFCECACVCVCVCVCVCGYVRYISVPVSEDWLCMCVFGFG